MQLVASRRLGAVLAHLTRGSCHKTLNVVPFWVNTRTSATGPEWTLPEINVINKDTVSYSHVFQPWDFDDFDKLARVPVGTIAIQMPLISYLLGNRYFFQPPEKSKDEPFKLVFTRGQSFEFLPAYYRHLAPGKRTTATVKLCSLGNTSWVTLEEIRDSSTNDLMVKGIFQRINVDATTRRPEQLHDWLKEKYSYLASSGPHPQTVQPFHERKSTKTFRYSVVVAPRDTDIYHHTNQASYIWFCMDGAMLGARNGAYSVLRGNLAKFDLKKVAVLYQKESLEGDVLDIESWEDQGSPDTLRFQVKKGNENITQLTMQFYLPTA
uniref:MaoC-like domain-containing protein n=1 Tax=Branchiostoma floridae TaxID=7739 RepID=C3YIK2_BRAFL|eukprot:XP_002603924.1 hypothetical protein BRAFLDRAFT_105964 [Branchiostoma floridae]